MDKQKSPLPIDYSKPIAYDVNGQPLYAHPPVNQTDDLTNNQAVHLMRPSEPAKQIISDATKLKNRQSKKIFPGLNLSEGEYVIKSISRNPIGLVVPMALGLIMIIIVFIFLFNLDLFMSTFQSSGVSIDSSVAIFPAIIFIGLVLMGMYISYHVYTSNKFFLTNESVVQETQTSLFSKREQTVSLINIEDVSYIQNGIIQQIFNYGSIRLSTEGEETTYRFNYVSNPKETIAALNNAVEAFKNGRAVSED